MKQATKLIVFFLLLSLFAHAQNPNPLAYKYTTMAEALATRQDTNSIVQVDGQGNFIVKAISATVVPDSVLVLDKGDGTAMVRDVSQSKDLWIEWFKLPSEKDWYNALRRAAKYCSAIKGLTLNFSPAVHYPIDTMKTGTPIPLVNTTSRDSLITDSLGNVTDTVILTTYDTILHITRSFTPNSITNILWLDPQNLTIKGNGATIDIKGNFDRQWTHTNASGNVHFSAYNTVCPFEIAWGTNVTIENLTIDGNNDQMTESGGVNEGDDYGIVFRGTDGITVKDVTLHHLATDGLYIEGSGGGADGPNGGKHYHASRNATIDHVKSLFCGRQGLTIGGLYIGHFKNCDFSNTGDTTGMGNYKGHAPAKGFDAEPVYEYAGSLIRTDRMTSDITFENCRFADNAGGAIAMSHPLTTKGISFIHCPIDNSKFNHFYFVINNVNDVTFDHCPMNTGTGGFYLTRDNGANQKMTLTNNTIISGSGVFLSGNAAQYGVTVDNNNFIGDHDTSFHGNFPYIGSSAIFTNNHILVDSALYLSSTPPKGALFNSSVLTGNNIWKSEMDTLAGRPIYPVSYQGAKSVQFEDYTQKQSIRPLGAFNWDFNAHRYSNGESTLGFTQSINAGNGITITDRVGTGVPTTGIFKEADLVRMIHPGVVGNVWYVCTLGGDASLGTAQFAPVGTVSLTGAPVYHNAHVVSGSDDYIGRAFDSGATSKLATALLPNGGVYFTKAVNDTGIIAFKSPFTFGAVLADMIIEGNIFIRGKGLTGFTVNAKTNGNFTLTSPALTLKGDSSLLSTKVRWLKDASNAYYLAFNDTNTVNFDKTVISMDKITFTSATNANLPTATTAWTPLLIKSLSGFTATNMSNTAVLPVTAGGTGNNSLTTNRLNYYDGSKIASSGIDWNNTNGTATVTATGADALITSRTVGSNTGQIRIGGTDGRTIGSYINNIQDDITFNANNTAFNGNLKISPQHALTITNWTGTTPGFFRIGTNSLNNMEFITNLSTINMTLESATAKTIFGGAIRPKLFTVATLPTGSQGDMATVTDALSPVNGATVVGGGTGTSGIQVVFYNGVNWVVFGANGSVTNYWQRNGTTVTTATTTDNVTIGGVLKVAPPATGTAAMDVLVYNTTDSSTKRIAATNFLNAQHPAATGSAPAIGSNGTNVTASINGTGKDAAFQLTLVVGTGGASGTLCAITFNSAWTTIPYVVFSPATILTAGAPVAANATSTSNITVSGTLAAGTYVFNFHCEQ